jgi:hypothetical protein
MTARASALLIVAVAVVAALSLLIACVTVLAVTLGVAPPSAQPTGSYGPSEQALADIPPAYLRIYESAAQRYGLDWAVLAAIGKVECDHGRDPDPSCTREGALNRAGAGGPAQFLRSSWRAFGVDGDGDGRADQWDGVDAFFSAANYLHAYGAPGNYARAIFAYNHAWSYVRAVLAWAQRYRGALLGTPAMCVRSSCDVAASGYVSPIPATASLTYERVDQGQDLLTDPGGALRAIGDGYVTTAYDPSGFGPDYPVLHLSAGLYAGRAFYYGHTFPVRTGRVSSGEIIARTGTHGVGNATIPGWAEIGAWPPGDMAAGYAIVGFLRSLPRV